MKKSNLPEIICFFIFCAAVIALSFFHEPWFDEFQAWGISKDSIFNILFVVPHLEGHPPLWHLILKCFSFFNVNCELGIKIPNLLFMFGAVWLLIFKSPFPQIIKLALPFTYFIFYQYSIISRPYSIFCFSIFLAAYFYKERNEHPFKFISALALLCLSCAYGMIISTGIIIAWFIEILKGEGISKVIKTFIKDKRFFAMFIIFLLCAGLVLIIIPDKDVIAISPLKDVSPAAKILYSLFLFPSDALITDYFNYSYITKKIFNINLLGCLIGLLINILLFCTFKSYKKLSLFLIPYIMFICTALFLHINVHHIGLLTAFFIFAFWCAVCTGEQEFNQVSHSAADSSQQSKCSFQYNKKLKNILISFTIIAVIVQIYWSIYASICDIKYSYSSGREAAAFIKENNLDNCKIMSKWVQNITYKNKITKKEIFLKNLEIPEEVNKEILKHFDKIKTINFNYQYPAFLIMPYFNKNIVYSLNVNHPDKEYLFLKQMSENEVSEIKTKLRQHGLPDILLNKVNLNEIFSEEELEKTEYILLKRFYSGIIWKGHSSKNYDEIYMKKDLYNKLFTQEVRNEEK